jgi:hypothetical protein
MKLDDKSFNLLKAFFEDFEYSKKGMTIKKKKRLTFILNNLKRLFLLSRPKGVGELKKVLRSIAPDVFAEIGGGKIVDKNFKESIMVFLSRILSLRELERAEKFLGFVVSGEDFFAAQVVKKIPPKVFLGTVFFPGTEKVSPKEKAA